MTKLVELEKEFANYTCKASDKPQVWFLQLKWIVKQINENGGSKSKDNIVMKVLNEAPEEYRTETLLAKNELKNLKKVNKTKLYLKEVRDLYNQGYSKEYALASILKGKNVAFMGEEQVPHCKKQFKGFCRNCGKQGHKSFECR